MGTFAGYLVGVGLSPRTVGLYVRTVTRAMLFFADRGGDLLEVSAPDLALWASTLTASLSARRQARSALQHYFTWMGKDPSICRAIRLPPKPRYFCQAISEHEAKLLNKVALEEGHPRGTAVALGLYLALRVSEIASAKWDGFDRHLETYTLTGKGDFTATIPVHPQLAEYLAPLETRYRYLFPGHQGRAHVSPQAVWKWIRQLGEVVGIENLRPHQLRHTAIATVHDNTGDLRTASEFARHRRIETTMIYTRTMEATLRSAVYTIDY